MVGFLIIRAVTRVQLFVCLYTAGCVRSSRCHAIPGVGDRLFFLQEEQQQADWLLAK
jgi:hypothetical protein